MMWYHVSEPNSYLAVTGVGIEKVKIVKKCMVMPFQKVTKISITPFDFSLSLQAMTSEKLQFSLPAVFTIGPLDEMEALSKYAVLLTGDSDGQVASTGKGGTVATGRNHVQDIVKGIIEGETRSIVSNMTMEELFNNRRLFKAQVIECVQKELDQFGLRIYNANVKELQDMGDSRYFESLARKAHEGAQSQAQVDVAHARMIGQVGEAEKQGEAKQKIAKINAHTAVLETERKVEKANADQVLRKREIAIQRELNLEQIASDRAGEERDAELKKAVEEKRAQMELERQRATTVVQAKIARESAQQKADADLYSSKQKSEASKFNQQVEADAALNRTAKDAEAALYKRTKEAEAEKVAQQAKTEAEYLRVTKEADAALYKSSRAAESTKVARDAETEAVYNRTAKDADAAAYKRIKDAEAREREAVAACIAQEKEAEGLQAMAKAYGALANVLGGPQGLMQFLMLQNNTFEHLAEANAKALAGMQPKINIWNTGNQEGVDSTAPIRNLFQSLPPLLSTIQDQTGMRPPQWLAQMPQQPEEMSPEEKQQRKLALVNGHH